MKIIESYLISRSNMHVINEIKPNEAVIVCNHNIMEQLLKKGVTFKEMYPGVFIISSIDGKPILQDIEKIDRVIRLYNPDFLDDSNLVAQMSQEKMDTFFQNYLWSKKQKRTMHIRKVEYKGKTYDVDQGSLVVKYQEGKRGREFTFNFGDGRTQLLGYNEAAVRIEDVWDKYLFDETVKPWLEKNKLNLALEVHTSPNKQSDSVINSMELDDDLSR